jgi:dTDP-6-deoxy-L-talose 4-dehydrogenase (NAD+)
MKVLVTGATGFIGRYVINELLKYDHTIIAAVQDDSKDNRLPAGISTTVIDLDNLEDNKDHFISSGSPDLLIHLAWQGLPNYTQSFHISKNLPSHSLFLENMIRNGLKDLAVTGTCFEYGMKEGMLSEDMESEPANPYAKAKDALRRFLQGLQEKYSFNLKWIRLFYMYGKGQSANSLLSQLEKALDQGDEIFNMSGGGQIRDYLPVEKVAEYIVNISLQNRVNGIINCCSGRPVTVKALVEKYLQQHNKKIKLNLGYYPYPDYEPMAFWGDDRKLKSAINND